MFHYYDTDKWVPVIPIIKYLQRKEEMLTSTPFNTSHLFSVADDFTAKCIFEDFESSYLRLRREN